jgi:hypothetical protein
MIGSGSSSTNAALVRSNKANGTIKVLMMVWKGNITMGGR